MRKTLVLTAIAACLVCSGGAYAATGHENHQGVPSVDRTDSGIIQTMNSDQHTITLANGNTYAVPSYVDLGSFKTGEHVSVLYTFYLDKNYSTVKNVHAE